MRDYYDEKREFFKDHKGIKDVYTSNMDEYGRYSKIYTCEDEAQWTEEMSIVTRSVEITIENVNTEVSINLFKVEYYDTDNAKSRYYYERA